MDLMRTSTTTTMSYHLCIVLILLLELHLVRTLSVRRQKRYTAEDICHHTEETLRDVKICPQSDTIWRQQMQIKNCSSHPTCKGEPLVYHCVKWNDTFIEVCAPSAEITGKCCSVFDKKVGRITEDYSRECPECPMHYSSDTRLIQCVESTSFTTTEKTDTTFDYRLSTAAAAAATATTRLPHKQPSLRVMPGKYKPTNDSLSTENDISKNPSLRVISGKYKPTNDSLSTETDISKLKEEENTLVFITFIVLIIPGIGVILFCMKRKDKIGARRHQNVLAAEESKTPLATERTEVLNLYPTLNIPNCEHMRCS